MYEFCIYVHTYLLWKNPEEWDWPRYTSMYSTLLPPSHISPPPPVKTESNLRLYNSNIYCLLIGTREPVQCLFSAYLFELFQILFCSFFHCFFLLKLYSYYGRKCHLQSVISSIVLWLLLSVKKSDLFFPFWFLPVVLFSSFFHLLYIFSSIPSCHFAFLIFLYCTYLSSQSSLFL